MTCKQVCVTVYGVLEGSEDVAFPSYHRLLQDSSALTYIWEHLARC